jgi:hypothetical protein
MPAASHRTAFIAGLRDLANYLTQHPALPVPDCSVAVNVFPADGTEADRQAGVDQFAATTGTVPAAYRRHYTATKAFGPIEYTAVAISDALVARFECCFAGWSGAQVTDEASAFACVATRAGFGLG